MKNLGILIFESFLFYQIFRLKLRQIISYSISLFLPIIDFKFILQWFLGLTDMTRTQVFCINELTEVIIVCNNKDFVFASFQVMTPSIKGFNNS